MIIPDAQLMITAGPAMGIPPQYAPGYPQGYGAPPPNMQYPGGYNMQIDVDVNGDANDDDVKNRNNEQELILLHHPVSQNLGKIISVSMNIVKTFLNRTIRI